MKKVVTIGGGTGSFTLLNGLKKLDNIELSAIVAMTDDGGSTGILRDELGVLPPGDIRQALVALSEEDEVFRQLISYRFSGGKMKGHNFGNIFLAGLEKVTGNFTEGLTFASKILKIKGEILPVIEHKAILVADLVNGKKLVGENTINTFNLQKTHPKKFHLNRKLKLYKKAKQKILHADYIIIGPGNLFCSIIPNFLASDFKETIKKSKATIIYISNLTNKKGHTSSYNLSNYVEIIEGYLDKHIDVIIYNNERPKKETVIKYELQEGKGVSILNDMKHDTRVVSVPLLSNRKVILDKNDSVSKLRSFIRHDSNKLRNTLSKIFTLH